MEWLSLCRIPFMGRTGRFSQGNESLSSSKVQHRLGFDPMPTGPGLRWSLRLILPLLEDAWPYPMFCGDFHNFHLVSCTHFWTWLQCSTCGGKGKGHGEFQSSSILCQNNLLVTATGAWKVIMTSAWEKGVVLNLRKKDNSRLQKPRGLVSAWCLLEIIYF